MCRLRYHQNQRRRPGHGIHPGKAQGTLEIVVAVIPILILSFCAINLFIWLNERMVRRQKRYEESRSSEGAGYYDESADPKLDVFKGWKKLKEKP